MADEYIQLNKPLYGGGKPSAPAGKTPERPERERPAPPVFAGFFLRLLALSFDVLIIVVLHNFLSSGGMRDRLFEIAPLCPLIGLGALILLFVVVPSQVFPGQTLGKKMLRLRVVTLEGDAPPPSAHIKRFVIVFALFLHGYLVEMTVGTQAAAILWPMPMSIMTGIIFSLYLTQISFVSLNPLKQGVHDLWADTYVVRNDHPEPIPAAAIETFDDLTLQRAQRASRMAKLTFPILILVFTFMSVRRPTDEGSLLYREMIQTLYEETGLPVSFNIKRAPIDDGTEPEINPQTGREILGSTAWVIAAEFPAGRDVVWNEVASSEAHIAVARRIIDTLEEHTGADVINRLANAARPPEAALVNDPLGLTMVSATQDYVILPYISVGRRRVTWRNLYLPLRVPEDLIAGVDLIPPPPRPVAPEPATGEIVAQSVSPELAAELASP